jgi:hypothetical protein
LGDQAWHQIYGDADRGVSHSDQQIWDIVAFPRELRSISEERYLSDHPTVPYKDDFLDPIVLFDFMNLIDHSGLILGIACINLHANRAPLSITNQPDDTLFMPPFYDRGCSRISPTHSPYTPLQNTGW